MRSVNVKILLVMVLIAAGMVTSTLILKQKLDSDQKPAAAQFELTDGSDLKFYSNNTITLGIADPFVLKASNGKYYLYGTTGGSGYKVYVSEDLINWKESGFAFFSGNAKWAGGVYWAPEVVERNNKFYMYYSANLSGSKTMRIGVAVSDKPEGPFKDVSDKPLFDFGYGTIDADVLVDDDGRAYLYYSRDCSENIYKGRHESHIYGIELDEDMVSVKGEPVRLLTPDSLWEMDSGEWLWNEGPFCFKRNGTYYLMYSANFYDSKSYSVGYATSKSPLGSFVKSKDNPLLTSNTYPGLVSGPGHNSVVDTEDGLYAIYHRHSDPRQGGGARQLSIDPMGIRDDGSLYINGPSIYPFPAVFNDSGLKNIAPESELTVSSTKAGYNPKGAADREITLDKRFERYEWVASNEDTSPSVQIHFPKARKVSAILIYGSVIDTRKTIMLDVYLNDSHVIKNVIISPRNGEPSILSFPEMDISDLKFQVHRSQVNSDAGISEIMVLSGTRP